MRIDKRERKRNLIIDFVLNFIATMAFYSVLYYFTPFLVEVGNTSSYMVSSISFSTLLIIISATLYLSIKGLISVWRLFKLMRTKEKQEKIRKMRLIIGGTQCFLICDKCGKHIPISYSDCTSNLPKIIDIKKGHKCKMTIKKRIAIIIYKIKRKIYKY